MNMLILVCVLVVVVYYINRVLENDIERLGQISDMAVKLEDLQEENRKLKAELTAQRVFYTREN